MEVGHALSGFESSPSGFISSVNRSLAKLPSESSHQHQNQPARLTEEHSIREDHMVDNEERPRGDGVGQSSTGTSQSQLSVKRKRKTTSDIWNYYRVEYLEDGNKIAYCNRCSKDYLLFRTSGTSNLIRHHEKCSNGLDDERRITKIDNKVAREKFSRVIIRHDLRFQSVEYEELRDYLRYLNPDYKYYTRNTAASDVMKTWEKEKQNLKSELEKIPSRIFLTSDCWTASTSGGG